VGADQIDNYKGTYDAGYDALRQSRLKRLKELGLVAPGVKPFPRLPSVAAWDELTGRQKKIEARKMEIYAAMIENIDHHVGRLFRHLRETSQWKNTLVIFFSDNGANGAEMHGYPETDEAWVKRNSDNRLQNMGRQFSRIATGPAWAQASMTPYRMFKGVVSEGGIRSPLIVSGPGVAKPGTRSDAFAHVMDIAATILDVSKTPHPGQAYMGRKIERLRGRSLLPVLHGKTEFVYKNDIAVNWELFGCRAVRKREFKLLSLPKPFGTGDWQLYDLEYDPGELNDLSTQRRGLRDEMAELWEKYARETGAVLPSPNPLGLESQ
jgi:arylsulfatase A-like enzyme